jgi:diguanylate cyclase (GGDEF)-like protein/PAS domain S-box-containing protein
MRSVKRRDARSGAGVSALRWIGAEVPAGHFFEGDHVAARVLPFIATGLVPFVLVPAVGVSFGEWQVLAALAVSAAIIGSAFLVPWSRLPAWTQLLPVLAGFAVIALLRDAAGEDAPIFEPLLIVPVAWVTLYGTRSQLWVAIGAMALTLGLPPLLIGEPTYDNDQLIRAGLAAVVAGTTGTAVQALVEATRELARESRAILESAQDAFISVDEGGTILEWNRQAERTFGWERDEIVGRNIVETIVPPEDEAAAQQRLRLFSERGEGPPSRRVEVAGRRRDGSIIPVEMTVTPVRVQGRWTFNSFVHDISDRKSSQEALQEAEQRFRRAFDENRVGMVLVARSGEFTRVNPAFCELLGYSPDQIVGRGFEEITHPDDVEANVKALDEIAAGERFGYRGEKRCLHRKGHHIWTAINVSGVRNESGELLHFIAHVEDITDRKEAEAELARQAMHDPLTSLPNRVLFADRVRMASARRDEGSFAVIYIDLDTFKPINDTYGHSAGDRVLVEVARRLELRLREGDTLARLGGDEFAILCEDADEASARLVAERVIEAFSKPFDIGNREVRQAASIGIAIQHRDGRAGDPEQILGFADLAMYRAKAAGKSRYAVFEGWMGEGHPDRGGLERELRRALSDGELTVHYQPEIELATGTVTGAEALVRWEHPERGLLEPADFMFLAEDSDLIVAIDDYVLWQACQEASIWREMAGDDQPFVISVNLSERRLAEPGLAAKIEHAITDAELPANSLCLEVAERAVFDRRSDTLAALPDLEQLGVRLLIDDFGVAVSSFSAIQRLPRLNAVKIDSSFIAGLGRSREDSTGVAAIIGLAHGLNLTATAEGVETADQLAVLRELDCDQAQGYFFARPQPAAAFRELLESARYGELLA